MPANPIQKTLVPIAGKCVRVFDSEGGLTYTGVSSLGARGNH